MSIMSEEPFKGLLKGSRGNSVVRIVAFKISWVGVGSIISCSSIVGKDLKLGLIVGFIGFSLVEGLYSSLNSTNLSFL